MMIQSNRLKLAVRSIAQDLVRKDEFAAHKSGEDQLLRELCSCILGSQVRYEVALSATNTVLERDVLRRGSTYAEVASRVEDVLRSPIVVNGRSEGYRFPRVKALQLAGAWQVVCGRGDIAEFLDLMPCAVTLREWLVLNVPGLGPKQASMFLRNCGRSYDLAVIDRHVITYMSMVGIPEPPKSGLSRLPVYVQWEGVLREHAREFGCPLGVLDWAIWIVMRAARSMTLPDRVVA